MQRFLSALETSDLRKDVYLHVCASVTTACILAAALFPWLRDVAETVSYIVALILLIRFGQRFHRALCARDKVSISRKPLVRAVYWLIVYVGTTSLLGVLGDIAGLIDPGFLTSQRIELGVPLVIDCMLAGPLEEAQRWALTFSLYFIGIRLADRANPVIVFSLSLVVSAGLFGALHLGKVTGHSLTTVLVDGTGGLFLSLFAYWLRSLWAAAALHSLYDLTVVAQFYLDFSPFGSWGEDIAVQVLTILGCALVLRRLGRQSAAGSGVPISSSHK